MTSIRQTLIVRGLGAVLLACACGPAIARTAPAENSVPLPRPRPADPGAAAPVSVAAILSDPDLARIPDPDPPGLPSDCQARLSTALAAVFQSQPAIRGPGRCGAPDVVRIEKILLPDKSAVAVSPPAVLRCPMAESVAAWVRDDLVPALESTGTPLRSLDNYASYHCRTRNNIAGARTSEHGFGNALDVRGVRLANGRTFEFTDRKADRALRETVRREACARFRTVLGPGSDGYHEDHIHLDLAQRARDFKLCQWAVLDPPSDIPLPRPRPPEAPGPEPAADEPAAPK
ncbi:MAG: extensin family protein [Pseudorhodoplanes sp.]|nr:extensin family protein [Pseudorhodoplanes sp.]